MVPQHVLSSPGRCAGVHGPMWPPVPYVTHACMLAQYTSTVLLTTLPERSRRWCPSVLASEVSGVRRHKRKELFGRV